MEPEADLAFAHACNRKSPFGSPRLSAGKERIVLLQSGRQNDRWRRGMVGLEGGGWRMQNTLDGPRHAKLTSILCIRNAFEPTSYRAACTHTCIPARARHRGHARTSGERSLKVLGSFGKSFSRNRFQRENALPPRSFSYPSETFDELISSFLFVDADFKTPRIKRKINRFRDFNLYSLCFAKDSRQFSTQIALIRRSVPGC